ncbi:hypothetical protein ACFXPI_02455 [Streptomyces sp. NPDC059104]|uniref:hypothetical protein n=1 Tax=Streptomyces sp. NPDC059104 TaxID=3346729 RepID=UPI0036C5D74A
MRETFHRARGTTAVKTTPGCASPGPRTLDPVSRLLADLAHYLMTPCPTPPPAAVDGGRGQH